MDLQVATVLTHAYVGTISAGFAVDDAVCNFELLEEGVYLSRYSG